MPLDNKSYSFTLKNEQKFIFTQLKMIFDIKSDFESSNFNNFRYQALCQFKTIYQYP